MFVNTIAFTRHHRFRQNVMEGILPHMLTGETGRRLFAFDRNYDRGRPLITRILWFVCSKLIFERWWFPSSLRPMLLRAFGASVGARVIVRHSVRIMWPWKLKLGDDCWVGESAWLITLDEVIVGSNVCISQEVLLCTGSHDHRRADFAYRNAPIRIEAGAWLGARSLVLPGVTVGCCSVVAAGEVARASVPDLHMLINGDLVPVAEPQ